MRPYDVEQLAANGGRLDASERILHRRVFMVFWRLAHDDLRDHAVSQPEVRFSQDEQEPLSFARFYDDILYECGLIDAPKLLDLICIFGDTQPMRQLVSKLILVQPNFFKDLRSGIFLVRQGIQKVATRIMQIASGQTLWDEIFDFAKYLYDMSFTLAQLVNVFPLAAFAIHNQGAASIHNSLLEYLVLCYEVLVPRTQQELERNSREYTRAKDYVILMGQQTKFNILTIIHKLLHQCYVDNISEESRTNSGVHESSASIAAVELQRELDFFRSVLSVDEQQMANFSFHVKQYVFVPKYFKAI